MMQCLIPTHNFRSSYKWNSTTLSLPILCNWDHLKSVPAIRPLDCLYATSDPAVHLCMYIHSRRLTCEITSYIITAVGSGKDLLSNPYSSGLLVLALWEEVCLWSGLSWQPRYWGSVSTETKWCLCCKQCTFQDLHMKIRAHAGWA